MNKQTILTPEELHEHWQSHRRLTRKVIEAFPENKLFEFSIGGMRPFAKIAMELTGIAGMGIHGIAKGAWNNPAKMDYHDPNSALSQVKTKAGLLEHWDEATRYIDEIWPQIPPARFRETDSAFGQYEGEIWEHICYFIDNENHHRGQGYVYLRALNIEPPYFWDRY